MNSIFTVFLLLIINLTTFAQDGSDISYVPIKELNRSHIGKFVHIDFYRRSFGPDGIRVVDTVIIKIDDKPIKFIEVRTDDGYTNSFSRQYLESVESFDGQTIRISKCRIDDVTKDSISVTLYIEYYDSQKKLLAKKSKQQASSCAKEIISEVLIHSKQR
jgi:hypothetical protein